MQSVFFSRQNNNASIIKLVVLQFFRNQVSDPSPCKAEGILRVDRTREGGHYCGHGFIQTWGTVNWT
jgi:hypothetical protein